MRAFPGVEQELFSNGEEPHKGHLSETFPKLRSQLDLHPGQESFSVLTDSQSVPVIFFVVFLFCSITLSIF